MAPSSGKGMKMEGWPQNTKLYISLGHQLRVSIEFTLSKRPGHSIRTASIAANSIIIRLRSLSYVNCSFVIHTDVVFLTEVWLSINLCYQFQCSLDMQRWISASQKYIGLWVRISLPPISHLRKNRAATSPVHCSSAPLCSSWNLFTWKFSGQLYLREFNFR